MCVRVCVAGCVYTATPACGSAAPAFLAGDLNWTDPVKGGKPWDGPLPLAPPWLDAWLAAGTRSPQEGDGFTYDGVSLEPP
jgi:hypothetical protein